MPASVPPTAASKLSAPRPRPEAIVRERLSAALDRASQRRLTVVCAPAGFGKTTAVVQWLEAAPLRHAWLSLDDSDNDPRWFAGRLLAALGRPLPEGALAESRRAFEAGSEIEATVVPLLANSLAACLDRRLALVLDDFHVLAEPACHRLTSALVDALPPELPVIVTSRTLPPLRLGRRRAAGQLGEIGAEQLRFAVSEAEQLLNGPLQLDLGRDQIELIDERLRGWAAGLALAASAIAGQRDSADVLAALDRSRAGLDAYLTEEVLEAAPPELAEFLLRTSVLSALSPSLCEAVSGDPRAAELLEEARRMNLFVTPLDGRWLRYHDVFAATLRGLLERRRPGLAAELHGRASTWFEQAGQLEEATEHAILAGDGPRAAALLTSIWIGLIGARRHVTLRRFLRRLPEDRGELEPFCEALDLLCAIFEGADQRATAERARALAARHGEDPRVRLVLDGILTSPFYGEVGTAVAIGREAWGRYADVPEARQQLVGPLALALWFAGEQAEVRALLEPRLRLEQPTLARVWTPAILALTAADEGDAGNAEAYAREAMAAVTAAGAETATEFTGLPWVVAEALRVNGKLAEAREQMDRGVENEAKRPGSVGHAVALIFDARLALDEHDRDRARRSAARARDVVDRYPDLGTLPDRLAAVEAALSAAAEPLLGSLPTAAERRVLALLDSPLSLAEIGAQLYVSRDTVKSHTRRLYRRLGVGTREEAVASARERGLLGEDRP
jgi:LuxR family maltose regulon positive regulatory protein